VPLRRLKNAIGEPGGQADVAIYAERFNTHLRLGMLGIAL
jgi:hypothetical protein